MTPNQFPTAEQVTRLRSQYPKGTRVELLKMCDPQAPPVGTHGTCLGVDSIGSILVAWDNGSHLNAAFGEDIVRLLPWVERDGEGAAVLYTRYRALEHAGYGCGATFGIRPWVLRTGRFHSV